MRARIWAKEKPPEKSGGHAYLQFFRISAKTISGKSKITINATVTPLHAKVNLRVSVVFVYRAATSGKSFLRAAVSTLELVTAL